MIVHLTSFCDNYYYAFELQHFMQKFSIVVDL